MKRTKPRKSDKTNAIMEAILRAADYGDFLHWSQIAERIPKRYSGERGCIKRQLDALIGYGILTKFFKDRRIYYKPTEEAYKQFRMTPLE